MIFTRAILAVGPFGLRRRTSRPIGDLLGRCNGPEVQRSQVNLGSRHVCTSKLERVTVLAMAKTAPYANEADYVVVGSGSSGAAIAGRLAESGASVIVVEAGKSDNQFLVKKPGMIGPMHSVPEIKQRVDWGFYSTPQKHLLERKMPVPRGKVVGGSSSINGMVYVRGNRANYD